MADALKFTSDDGQVVLVETTDVPDRPLTARGRRAGDEANFRIALRWAESRSR